MTPSDDSAAQVFDALASFAMGLITLGAPFTAGGFAAAALLRTAARRIRHHGESVDVLLCRLRCESPVGYEAALEDTLPERPSVRPPR